MSKDHQPLDLGQSARRRAACGFEDELLLRSHQAAGLARRLRGIGAVAAVLTAENDNSHSPTAMDLGNFLRAGLVDALAMLAKDAECILECANDGA